MTQDDLEFTILKRFVDQHAEAQQIDPDRQNKCLRELNLRNVLAEVTGATGAVLDQQLQVWFARLIGRDQIGHPRALRPCSDSTKNQAEHRYFARAYVGEHAAPAWDRIRELERSGARIKQAMSNGLKLFISHSSTDGHLAARLIDLVRSALNLPASAIRCTSVDGYRLPGGADTNEQLRREVHEAEAFIGIVSDSSLRSLFVLFELGARWGASKHLLPLLSPGTNAAILSAPLDRLNALRADNRAQLQQLVTDLGSVLKIQVQPPASYEAHISAVLDLTRAKEATAPDVRIRFLDPPAPHLEVFDGSSVVVQLSNTGAADEFVGTGQIAEASWDHNKRHPFSLKWHNLLRGEQIRKGHPGRVVLAELKRESDSQTLVIYGDDTVFARWPVAAIYQGSQPVTVVVEVTFIAKSDPSVQVIRGYQLDASPDSFEIKVTPWVRI